MQKIAEITDVTIKSNSYRTSQCIITGSALKYIHMVTYYNLV